MAITRRQTLQLGVSLAAFAATSRAAGSAKIKLVVLDVGGTIIEDRGDVPEAMIDAFARFDISIQPQDIAPLRGASKKEVIRKFVDERAPKGADRMRIAGNVYSFFNAKVIEAYKEVPPIKGAEDAFKQMRAAGIALVATTGFGRPVAESIFNRLKWLDYFVDTVTADDVTAGRPAPFMIYHAMEAAKVGNVAEVIAVGDTPLDIQAANNGGVRGIGVLSGAGTESTISAAKPAAILKSVADLPAWIKAQG